MLLIIVILDNLVLYYWSAMVDTACCCHLYVSTGVQLCLMHRARERKEQGEREEQT